MQVNREANSIACARLYYYFYKYVINSAVTLRRCFRDLDHLPINVRTISCFNVLDLNRSIVEVGEILKLSDIIFRFLKIYIYFLQNDYFLKNNVFVTIFSHYHFTFF